jgi:hypothetical protein
MITESRWTAESPMDGSKNSGACSICSDAWLLQPSAPNRVVASKSKRWAMIKLSAFRTTFGQISLKLTRPDSP